MHSSTAEGSDLRGPHTSSGLSGRRGGGEGSNKKNKTRTSVHQPSPRTIIWWITGWMADLHGLQWLIELEKPNSHVTLMQLLMCHTEGLYVRMYLGTSCRAV